MVAKIEHHNPDAKTLFGFWVYIMTDCMLFGSLFAAYAVLRNNTFGGPSGRELFSLPFVLVETLLLLTSSFTSGLAMLPSQTRDKKKVIGWLLITFVLGASFVGMEISEFTHLVREGNSWSRSGFLTSFFTLVATHGCHISVGLIWILVMIGQLYFRGVSPTALRRLACFKLFWHFLDLVWIFIFTFVYLMGAL